MSAQADAALSFDRAGFTYAGAREPALADVSLSVPAGQCVVLTGGSGCGKTTLTRLANGLIPVSYDGELAGSVRIAGKDAGSWEMDALCRRVGSVFQNPRSQFFNLDTTSEVAFGCENLGLSRAEMHRRVDGAFALLGIEHLRDRDIRALSGGQRRRIDIARALLHRPRLLILDEPTTGLDPQTRSLLWQVVAGLRQEENLTVFLTTHYMEEAADAGYVVLLDHGRIAAEGTPLQLKNTYAHDTLTLYGVGEADVRRLGLPYAPAEQGWRVTVPDPAAAAELIRREPALFRDFELTKGRMDDVFLAVTGKKLAGGAEK